LTELKRIKEAEIMGYYSRGSRRLTKKKRQFSDYIVFISIFAVTFFTIAAFILQFEGLMEISSTLTQCWFAFWTVEIVALASIKNRKIKEKYKDKKEESNNGQG
jgi:hypothetical protein